MWSLGQIMQKSDFPTVQALRMKLRRCGVTPAEYRPTKGAPKAFYAERDVRWALKGRFHG